MPHPLWGSVYPNARPVPLLQLPRCAHLYAVFVYDLPREFHVGLLDQMEKARGQANCDFARSPCVETRREPLYSTLRQYAAEVPLLAKLLMMPRASRAVDADLIVVPWLASTELSAERRPWYPKNSVAVARFQAMRERLTDFEVPELRARHLFLSSRDWTFTVVPLRELVTETGALLATYGPRRPHRRNELLIAPNDAGFGRPLAPLSHPAGLFLFAMFDESINRIRMDFGSELRRLNMSQPHLRLSLHPIVDHKTLPLPPEQAHALMSDSLICPIVQGDLPYQHRLFDALACGCVPLLLSYRSPTDPSCETWSWDPRNRSVQSGAARMTVPDALCLLDTLPYGESVDWEAITVRIDASALAGGQLAEAIAALDQQALGHKRRRLEKLRHLFVWDWTGETYDAFSAWMAELCTVLPPRNDSAAGMRRGLPI